MLVEIARDGSGRIGILAGDITEYSGGGIVNAANSGLLGGGGIDGAIHRAAGTELSDECCALRATSLPGGLPAGKAVSTGAGRLRVRRVIHTVGPVWRGGTSGERETLASCYRTSLELARDEGLESLGVPAVSTGAYGFPPAAALEIALRECRAFAIANALPARIDLVFFTLAEARAAAALVAAS
ncbi:MAG: macro domain-containing protein [Spirochaetales bacterium]|nr:macro domain-containing protein [Spirochaetales bacterium]